MKFFFQIIYDINFNFMEELKKRIGLDFSRLSQMSIVDEGAVKVFKKAYPKIAFIRYLILCFIIFYIEV